MRLRGDANEPAHDAVEVAVHLCEGERLRHVLADRVQAAVVFPRVEDVPLVYAAVHRVEGGRDRPEAALAVRIAEARRVGLVSLSGDDLDVLAARDPRAPRESSEVDVDVLARRLVPEEADEVALVLLDRHPVVPLASDFTVQRVRHPGRAVDRRAGPHRETMPRGPPALRARPNGCRACPVVRVLALRRGLALSLGACGAE